MQALNRKNFPLIALVLSVPLLLALLFGGQSTAAGDARLPLLTLLAISELGVIANSVAAWLSLAPLVQGQLKARSIVVGLLAVLFVGIFIWHLAKYWPS